MRRVSIAVLVCSWLLAGSTPARASGLEASPGARWDREYAAHLLSRAGFGGTPEEIDSLVTLGRDRAVDRLVDYEKLPRNDPPYPRGETARQPDRRAYRGLDEDQRRQVGDFLRTWQNGHVEALREWWLHRMIVTNRPLEEKMTLFWHGTLTSGFREVRSWQLLLDQNEFLRANALSDFRTLIVGISRDGAMMRYLDTDRNVKGQPNENFARELLELFTMGEGHYTETDVREAARAFTGYALGPDGFLLRPRQHDTGTKTFLGKTGSFDGTEIIDIVLDHPATSRHLANRLWEHFAYLDPEPEIIERLAAELRRTKFDLRAAMRALLRSDAFYSPRSMRAQIKSPVELVVGTVKRLEIEPGDLALLARVCRQTGQQLFQPPNVKGWDGGRAWITTSTLVARQNFGRQLLSGTPIPRRGPRKSRDVSPADGATPPAQGGESMVGGGRMRERRMSEDRRRMIEELDGEKLAPVRAALSRLPDPPRLTHPQAPYDPLPTLKRHAMKAPREIVQHYVARLLQTSIAEERMQTLVSVLSPDASTFDFEAKGAVDRIRNVIHLISSMPEYQLN